MPLVTRQSNQGILFKEATTPNWSDGDVWSDTTSNTIKLNVSGTATGLIDATTPITIGADAATLETWLLL